MGVFLPVCACFGRPRRKCEPGRAIRRETSRTDGGWQDVARRSMERETGIEPAPSAWKAEVLPLNYSRDCNPLARTAPAGVVFSYRCHLLVLLARSSAIFRDALFRGPVTPEALRKP